MKKNLVWLVLVAAIAIAAAMVVSGRLSTAVDDGPHLAESDMPKAEDFEKMPPTGEDMNLEEMSVSFAGETNKVVRKVVEEKLAK